MRRRVFIAALGGATAAWASGARAQQLAAPVVGFLSSGAPGPFAHLVAAYREGLREMGFADGRNVVTEFRWADGNYDRLPGLAQELVQRNVAVIAATGGSASAIAAVRATQKIPIVVGSGTDPMRLGLVDSLGRPSGNVTGINMFTSALESKRLGLLREVAPRAAMIAVLLNPNSPNFNAALKDVQEGARSVGQQIHILQASTADELDEAFATAKELGAEALLIAADPYFYSERVAVVGRATRLGVPTIYEQREFAAAGGLMSYGTSLADGYRQMGVYVGRILRGEKPSDLPVQQSTKFEFVINSRSAAALGLSLPESIYARADEVIE